MKILSFILVVLLGGFMPAGNLSAADKKQNPHHITVKTAGICMPISDMLPTVRL